MADGSTRLVDVHRGVARVPQLAVHLDRTVNDGLKLDPQQHLRPVWGVGNPVDGDFAAWIAEQAGCDEPAFWDLCLYDVQSAAVIGGDQSLLASGRLDNQVSCWAAASALIAAEPHDAIATIVLNDHEEVGSASTTGAAGPLLERDGTSRDGARRIARRLPAGARWFAVRLRRQRPRRPSQLRRAPRSRSPPDGEQRAGDQGQQQPALRDLARNRRCLPSSV